MDNCQFTLVIPSLNPDEILLSTVSAAVQAGTDDIFLVDDGSTEENRHYFTELAEYPQVTVLTHEKNRGKGTVLKTAFHIFGKAVRALRRGDGGRRRSVSDRRHLILCPGDDVRRVLGSVGMP